MKYSQHLLAFAAVAALAAPAQAVTVTATGPGVAIPDSPAPGVISSLNVAASGVITSVSVRVATTHTWVGDLIYSLSHSGTTVVLMDRPGVPTSTFGNSANLAGTSPLNFSATGLAAAETIGNGCLTGDTVGVTATCLNTLYLPQQSLAAFNSASVTGAWVLTVSDNAGGDTGSLASWTLTAEVTPIPEPASYALLGLGLLGVLGAAARRKA